MQPMRFGITTIDRCLACHGLWFDRNELSRARQHARPQDIDPGNPFDGFDHNAHRSIDCPRCHRAMIRLAFPVQTHIDHEQCPHCGGIYLDAGEYTDLTTFNRAERLRLWWNRVRR